MADQTFKDDYAIEMITHMLVTQEQLHAKGEMALANRVDSIISCFARDLRERAKIARRNGHSPTPKASEGRYCVGLFHPTNHMAEPPPNLYDTVESWKQDGGYSYPPPGEYELWEYALKPVQKIIIEQKPFVLWR